MLYPAAGQPRGSDKTATWQVTASKIPFGVYIGFLSVSITKLGQHLGTGPSLDPVSSEFMKKLINSGEIEVHIRPKAPQFLCNSVFRENPSQKV